MIARSSLAEFSPLNLISGRQVFFVYRLYFDGSGKADDPNSRFLALASCAAEEDVWRSFESEWRGALKKGGVPYLHMTDLMARRDPYAGWSDDQVSDFLELLFRVLRKNPQPIHACLFSVDLQAWRDLGSLVPLGSPARLCAEFCFYRAIELYLESNTLIVSGIDAYFDRGEPFRREIEADWESKSVKEQFPALELVRSMPAVDSRQTPGVQLADMLAWSTHRLLSDVSGGFHARAAKLAVDAISSKRVKVDRSQILQRFGIEAPAYGIIRI